MFHFGTAIPLPISLSFPLISTLPLRSSLQSFNNLTKEREEFISQGQRRRWVITTIITTTTMKKKRSEKRSQSHSLYPRHCIIWHLNLSTSECFKGFSMKI